MASDMFSLGGTLLFAAAGHAPYQGETVMDVLVRLATEPPDLTGLPPDLAGLVRACLERDPRLRPGPAAVLAMMAPFLSAETGAAPLPGPALELIAEYRRDPRPAPGGSTGPGDSSGPGGSSGPGSRAGLVSSAGLGDEATFGSQPVVLASRGPGPAPPAGCGPHRAEPPARRAGPSWAGGGRR